MASFEIIEVSLARQERLYLLYAHSFPIYEKSHYNTLFQNLIDKLLHLEQERYSVVLFCASATNVPPWSWIISAYYRLHKNLRKNIQCVYVVHPQKWTKILFQALGLIFSPKFNKKLSWFSNLEELSGAIPLPTLNIMDIIYSHDQSLGIPMQKKQLFGRPLSEIMDRETLEIPLVIRKCCDYISQKGLSTEGLFRIPGPKAKLDLAIYKCNFGCDIDIDAIGGIHSACSILKQYFRELPDTIFPEDLHNSITELDSSVDLKDFIKMELIPKLPIETKILFSFLFQTLGKVHMFSSKNLMTASNLSIVWTPNFQKGDFQLTYLKNSPGTDYFRNIIRTCIENHLELFY